MTPDEQRLYALINRPTGVPSPPAPTMPGYSGGGLPDIAAYLGLHGDAFGGHYRIDPRRPIGGEIPVHMQYTRPLYGGELNAEATLTPEQRAFLINYHRDF